VKCRVCREPAVIDVRRQNANYCRDHFLRMCRDQVAKAIDEFDMLRPGERVLVAVSGGKDSLACWQLLRDLGYEADGFVIGLGIGEYSDESTSFAQAFAEERGLTLHYCNLRDEHGFDVPTANTATTSSLPATISTTKPPCCSATCCAGRPITSGASCPCSRASTVSRAR